VKSQLTGRTWKVGELARLTGLTVRTLHHYDEIDLLTPSARTPSGHRLYDEHDVRRLYQVVALRALGLPLDALGTVIAGDLDVAELLRDHLAHVDQQLVALRALRSRLASVVAATAQPGSADLLGVIEEVSKMDETIRTYFTEEQLAALEQRREQLGEATIASAEAEWPRLIAQVQAELDAGTDPTNERVRVLARRWMELIEAFHGGDDGLRDSLYRMHVENSERVSEQDCGPTPELIDYVTRAAAGG
jgi:DNA-binding transcriptional MerR regulator